MWRAFLEVLQDLWSFVMRALKPKIETTEASAAKRIPYEKEIDERKVGVDIGYTVYVVVDKLDCHSSEGEQNAKNTVTSFVYGESLKHLYTNGKLALVAKGDVRCWVDATGIIDDQKLVFPSFEPYQIYRAGSDTTVKLRKCLSRHVKKKEEYLGSDEFVLYRLQKDSFLIPWEAMSTMPGKSWYQKLLNRRGVGIHTEPKTYAALEYLDDAGKFVYGYITAVQPDHTIHVESIGREEPGEFRVEQFSKVEWERWRPVFITFS
jgi:hypothetical protein